MMKGEPLAKSSKIGLTVLFGAAVSVGLFVAAAIGLSRALEGEAFEVAESIDGDDDLF